MGYLLQDGSALSPWIRRELECETPLKKGAKGTPAKRVQEWLNLHKLGLAVDGDFGRITELSVSKFQERSGLPSTGVVNAKTWEALVAPLSRALIPIDGAATRRGFPELVLAYAKQHLKEHPLEIGGQNCGPWVRLYMNGNQGTPWAWCAGFVTFVLKQAAQALQMTSVIPGSFSCDILATQAKSAGLFVKGSSIADGTVPHDTLPVAGIFLIRRTSTDWTHTGFVTAFGKDSFSTIEGNTNDDGNREGYEVCAATRGYGKKDFITLAAR
jgi:hypothetical protein